MDSRDSSRAGRGVDDRRQFLRKAAVGAGAAWVAPLVLSTAAAAQGSVGPPTTPPPRPGSVGGDASICGSPPGQQVWLIEARIGTTVFGSDTLSPAGAYLIGPLPPGTYDLVLVAQNIGPPDQTFPGIVVTAGSTTTFDPSYTDGCD